MTDSPALPLTDRVAIVTGAGRGIGRAIALELGRAGARVIVNYNRSAEAAEALAAEIGGVAVQADVCSAEGADRLVAAAEALGGLHILVNNAGITRDGLMLRMPDSDWQAVIDTNLTATFRMCRAAAAIMLRQRAGSIINLTSISGIRGNSGQANYAASKAAVAAMSRSLAKELARRGIRVNCVAPGFIATDMVDAMNRKVVEGVLDVIPMRRIGQPEEVAHLVRFLASDEARYITGQELAVDGGLSI
jgi:3-oxoacyl-[acyl-carrier protein] reductase